LPSFSPWLVDRLGPTTRIRLISLRERRPVRTQAQVLIARLEFDGVLLAERLILSVPE